MVNYKMAIIFFPAAGTMDWGLGAKDVEDREILE